MTILIDSESARISRRGKAVLGFLAGVVAMVAAIVTYFVATNTNYVKAEEFKPVKTKVEQHDVILEEIHEDFHWTRDQLWELAKSLGEKPLPLPKH